MARCPDVAKKFRGELIKGRVRPALDACFTTATNGNPFADGLDGKERRTRGKHLLESDAYRRANNHRDPYAGFRFRKVLAYVWKATDSKLDPDGDEVGCIANEHQVYWAPQVAYIEAVIRVFCKIGTTKLPAANSDGSSELKTQFDAVIAEMEQAAKGQGPRKGSVTYVEIKSS